MIVGIGTDIVDCKRIMRSYERFGEHFLDKIFTSKEKLTMPQNKNIAGWLASRFAVKEASVKALGTGFLYGISFTHIEVLREKNEAPVLTFLDTALEWAEKKQVKHYHVSYSHEKEYAVAYVVLES